MTTTAIQEFCRRCGRALGGISVTMPGKVMGKFHPECFVEELKPEEREAMATAPVIVAPENDEDFAP